MVDKSNPSGAKMAIKKVSRSWAIFLATLLLPGYALAQSHPEFIPLGRVSAALYKPDAGPSPHIAFLVSHRTANNLKN
jgi:hypothetical protein